MKYYIKKYQHPDSPLLKQGVQFLFQNLARKIGRTPSGYSLNIPKIITELKDDKESDYRAAFKSQDAYYYGGDDYFPKSTHTPRLDPNIKQYDVNFGRDVYEIPRQDSINFVKYINQPIVARQGFPVNGEFHVINNTNSKENYYDAGHHTLTPKKGEDGNYYVYLNDRYDFDNYNNYSSRYTKQDNPTPSWLQKMALKSMSLMGEPYETHQTVPVKFVNKQINEQTEVTSANVRDMFKNVLKLHNVELIKPVDSFSEDELKTMFVDGSGDDLIEHWKSLNLIKHKQGGSIHIKEKNKGKFTESAKRAGKSVQEHARDVVNNPKATKLQKKRAQFALNAKKFKHD